MTVEELTKKATAEQIAKIQECKTAAEILEVAKAENFPLTAEEAEEVIQVMYPPYGEISDDALDMVAGGKSSEPQCQHTGNVTLVGYRTENGKAIIEYKCNNCGAHFTKEA